MVLGLVASLFGGCPGLISGAAGVVAVPLAPLIANYGVAYMFPAVMLAGLMQLACSVFRVHDDPGGGEGLAPRHVPSHYQAVFLTWPAPSLDFPRSFYSRRAIWWN